MGTPAARSWPWELKRWTSSARRPRVEHDFAAVEEVVRHRDGLVEEAARIVAQVKHDALEILAELVLELDHRRLDAVVGLLAERGDADVADVVEGLRAHRLNLDGGALQAHLERLLLAAPYRELDGRIHRPAHLLDRLLERHALDGFVVELDDEIARLEARFRRRRVVDRRDDLDQAVIHGDLDAESAELAAGLNLHVAEAFGVHVARVRVERGQHAVDRGLDQLVILDRLDVVLLDLREHVAEEAERAIGVGAGVRVGGAGVLGRAHVPRQEQEGRGHGSRQHEVTIHPLTLPL